MNLLYNFINYVSDETIMALINTLSVQQEEICTLQINISSLGGSVSSAIAVYNYLKHQPFQVITHNLGEVSSASILLYLAGEIRTAEEASKFILHPMEIGTNTNFTYYKLKEVLDSLNADIKNYSYIVNQETNSLNNIFDIDKCLKSEGLVLDVQTALACGIVTNM